MGPPMIRRRHRSLSGNNKPLEFGTMKTNGKAIFFHTLLFFALYAILKIGAADEAFDRGDAGGRRRGRPEDVGNEDNPDFGLL